MSSLIEFPHLVVPLASLPDQLHGCEDMMRVWIDRDDGNSDRRRWMILGDTTCSSGDSEVVAYAEHETVHDTAFRFGAGDAKLGEDVCSTGGFGGVDYDQDAEVVMQHELVWRNWLAQCLAEYGE